MKWFKHLSDLPRDEGVSDYLDEAGKDRLLAYGFLILVLEAIASRMIADKGHLKCSATYSIPRWGRITFSHPNRVTKYLELCRVIGWVDVEFEEGSCTVSIPRMVEWRDETTRKSGAIQEQRAQKRIDQTKEREKESKKDNPHTRSVPDSEKAGRMKGKIDDLVSRLDANKDSDKES